MTIEDIASLEPAIDTLLRDRAAHPDIYVRYHVRIPPPSGGGDLTLELADGIVTSTYDCGTGHPVVKSRKLKAEVVLAFVKALKAIAPWQPDRGPSVPDCWHPTIEIQISSVRVVFSRFESDGTAPSAQLQAALTQLCENEILAV